MGPIPTLLIQGQRDSLFNLAESVATYHQLTEAGAPVHLVWQSAGHSGSEPPPNEYSQSGSFAPEDNYIGALALHWFDWYLKPDHGGRSQPTLGFSYFRPWALDEGLTTQQAYATAPAYPAGTRSDLYLSGADQLVSTTDQVATGAATFVVPPALPTPGLVVAGTSFSELSALTSVDGYGEDTQLAPYDVAGFNGVWTDPALTEAVDVVGIPTLDTALDAPTIALLQSTTDPTRQLVLFAKLYDVAPDGTATLMNRQVAPVRVDDVTKPLHVQLPGMVHRFDVGHRIRLALATSDLAYAGNSALFTAAPISVPTSANAPGVLSLPIVAAAATPATPVGPSAPAPAPTPVGDAGAPLPATGPTRPAMPLVALGGAVMAALAWSVARRPVRESDRGGGRHV